MSKSTSFFSSQSQTKTNNQQSSQQIPDQSNLNLKQKPQIQQTNNHAQQNEQIQQQHQPTQQQTTDQDQSIALQSNNEQTLLPKSLASIQQFIVSNPYQSLYILGASFVSLHLLKILYGVYRDNKRQYTVNQSLRQVIEKKQGQRSSSLLEVTQQNLQFFNFAQQRSITKDKMQKIFKLSLQQLIQQVKDGNFTVEEIKTAYLMRALDLAVESNYLAELFLEDKDLQRSQHSKQNDFKKVKQEHSLYGLTFSVADWLDQYGFDTSLGLASRCLNPLNQSENSSNVKEFSSTQSVFLTSLLKLQASPLYRSSVNQSASSPEKAIFTSECVNNIWGRANNPHQKDFTTGGACGGEAALVSTYCVGMGIGVDQAGCTRYPASCCGVVAFKPTANRVSSIGVNKVNNRQSNILQPVITPIARSVKDITHILKCLWDSQIQLQFDNTVNPKKFIPPYQNQAAPVLRIGYYLSDGLLEPSHAVKQALLMVKEALEDQGHIVVEFKMGAQAQGQDLLCQGVLLAYRLVCSSGQMKEYRDGLNGEEPVEEMKQNYQNIFILI